MISKGIIANMSSLLINRGLDDGIVKNLPVLSSKGVIGKITAVSKSSSEVQLISDVNFRLSVKIAPDEVEGIMRWIGGCLLYTSPSPRDPSISRMPSSA